MNLRSGEFIALGNTKRGAMTLENFRDLIAEPDLVPQLERRPQRLG